MMLAGRTARQIVHDLDADVDAGEQARRVRADLGQCTRRQALELDELDRDRGVAMLDDLELLHCRGHIVERIAECDAADRCAVTVARGLGEPSLNGPDASPCATVTAQ